MRVATISVAAILAVAAFPSQLSAGELQAVTVSAWNAYVAAADARLDARLNGQQPFLWIDEAGRSARVRRGEIAIAPGTDRGTKVVPDGLIHDWVGAAFIPNATIADLLAVVHDYNRYQDIYKPAVAESRAISCDAADQRFAMKWQHHILFINAAIQAQYQAHEIELDAHRGYSIVNTTKVQEIQNYGESGQHLLPPGEGNGFIWRLHSIARYEERDGGVYLELEAIALSRDIPASVRWMATPIVRHISMNSLATSLRQTRDAVNSQSRAALACTGRRDAGSR